MTDTWALPAANCARLFQVSVDRVEPAVRVGEVLARTAHQVGSHGAFMIPLVLALEFGAARGALFKQPHDGRAMFQEMMNELARAAP